MRSACLKALARPLLPLLLASAAGCSSDKDRVEKQLSKLRDEVAHLQSETDRMGERLDAMEVQKAAVPHYAEERVAEGSSTTISRPRLKVVRMEPGAEGPTADGDSADPPAPDADTGPRMIIQGEGKSLESRMLPAAPVAAKTTKADSPKAKPEPDKAKKADKSDKADAKASKSEPAPSK